MNKDEKRIEKLFADLGFTIFKIPELPDQKTPDFKVSDNDSKYLVEVKSKYPSSKALSSREEVLASGMIRFEQTHLEPRNTFSGIIEDGIDQLSSYIQSDVDFRLLWLHSNSHLSEAFLNVYHSTLFGSSTLIDWSDGGKSGIAYYVRNSSFYRFRDILDGAFISTDSKLVFCLNSYSRRYQKLRSSKLIAKLDKFIDDPIITESKGDGFIADTDIERSNEDSVLKYLKTKYGLSDLTKLMDLKSNTFSITVDGDGT